jgi:hypothetical protein
MFFYDLIANIGPIKTRDEAGRAVKIQAGNDLAAGEFICRGSERDPRYIWKTVREYR